MKAIGIIIAAIIWITPLVTFSLSFHSNAYVKGWGMLLTGIYLCLKTPIDSKKFYMWFKSKLK